MKVTWKKESKKRPLAAISKYANLPFDQQDMLHNDDEDNNSDTKQLGASHKSLDSEASNRQLADSFQDLGNKLAEVFPSLPHSSSSFLPWKVQIWQYYCGTYAIIEFLCDIQCLCYKRFEICGFPDILRMQHMWVVWNFLISLFTYLEWQWGVSMICLFMVRNVYCVTWCSSTGFFRLLLLYFLQLCQ